VTTVRSDIAHLYRRAGFGASPAQLEAGVAAGYEATVDGLVAGAAATSDPPADQVTPPNFAPYQRPSAPTGSTSARAQQKAQLQVERSELAPLQNWWLDRMIASAAPLREKLTLVWHGHFATAVTKVHDPHLMYLQNQLFRTAGAGSFETLAQAVAKDGAMMIWLDTIQDKKSSPNENFARELMERFTLGVGNYSQQDVVQAARCFTGWQYDRVTDHWRLNPRQHDDGSKTFLGQTGDFDGEEVVSIILARPESARFVASRLWSCLAYPVLSSDAVVGELLPAYQRQRNISDLLKAVFLHPQFRSPTARQGLVKQPIEYLVGAARTLGLKAHLGSSSGGRGTVTMAQLATAMAQTPFNPPNVGGWPPNGYWLNTATALARVRAGEVLVARGAISAVAGATVSQRVAAAADLLGVVDGWGTTTEAALTQAAGDPAQLMVLALNSPEYVLN
jgi:uncharacterized protein (DUF1800 family)